MKIAATLMVAGLLLAAAPAVAAAEADAPVIVAPQSQDLLSQLLGGEAPITPAGPCDPATLVDGQEPTLAATQFCGSCSEEICRGAIRGSSCRISTGIWGHCNIFSGGFRCADGRWDCQCRTGDLP